MTHKIMFIGSKNNYEKIEKILRNKDKPSFIMMG